MGGGGLGFELATSGSECVLVGLRLFFKAATEGGTGAAPEADGGGGGGAPPGLAGGAPFGLVGAASGGELFFEFVSGSESYKFTPPALFRSLGMPPAKMPPNCGAVSMPPPIVAAAAVLSLLLRALLCPGDAGGRRPPGIGGAPPIGGPLPASFGLSMIGAERSFTVTFFSRAPFSISPSNAPYIMFDQPLPS